MNAVKGRVIVSRAGGERVRDPYENLALEEALFVQNDGFMVRVWENSESVIIGRAQIASFETDVDYCKSHGVPIVRRFTAGGTVYNGPGNVNWSIFVGRSVMERPLRYESGPRAIFASASRPLVATLATLGVDAWLDPPNRIVTKNGKISGMAAYVSKKGFLCHGTLLVDADLQMVKALTTPSPESLERRYTRSRDVRTANAQVDVDSFIHTLVRTLGDETGLKLEPAEADARETALMEELLARRYRDDAWNLGDPFQSKRDVINKVR
ncbi:MAG: lipoate--protein ligase family protein [Thaumarchaeota archaeon]|nr:lipoate--protein ligase family protein [Nitrososphaerota archaeon]